MTPLPLLLACLLLVLLPAGCGDDENEAAAPKETATAAAAPGRVDVAGISKDLTAKPSIAKPSGEPPTELQKRDIVEGNGKAAKPGDTVSVQYVGNSWSTGAQFDASWDRGGEPFTFPLGAGQVIPGWDQGVVGMRVGGKRTLTIPPELGYGPRGAGGVIPPNAMLKFEIELLDVR